MRSDFSTTKLPVPPSICVCVCVFFPSILDIKFVGRTSRGHTGGRSHRISHPPSFCGACLNFSREKDSAIPCSFPPVLSACPLHTNSGCGKEGRILIGQFWSAKAALLRNYLEVYWPYAGGLSGVNAIGTQLRDPINSGLTRWRIYGGFINGRRRGTREESRK